MFVITAARQSSMCVRAENRSLPHEVVSRNLCCECCRKMENAIAQKCVEMWNAKKKADNLLQRVLFESPTISLSRGLIHSPEPAFARTQRVHVIVEVQ